MTKQVPRGWSQDTSLTSFLPSTPQGEVPIKREITFNGDVYAIITNSVGEYKVFTGGTGIFNQNITEESLIFSSSKEGRVTYGLGWNDQNIKRKLGGNAGLQQLNDSTKGEISSAFSQYLTTEEQDGIQNTSLKDLVRNLDVNPGQSDPEPVNLEDIDFGVTAEDFAAGEAGAYKDNQKFLQYPETLSRDQDRVIISQIRYSSKNATSFIPNIPQSGSQNADQSSSQEQVLGIVTLPIPNNLTETNSTGWGENSLSTLAGTIFGGAISAAKSIANPLNIDQEGLQQAASRLSSSGGMDRIREALTLNAAAAITKFVGINVDPEAFRSRATGTVINPNLQLLFNGPKLRSFGFEFKMIPRTKEEAKSIRYIIKFFKKGMSAVRKSAEGEGFYLGAPNVFNISFKSGTNDLKSIGKIKTCALQQMNVNYTPEGFYAAFQDAEANGSQPISVIMQLAFTELTPFYNDDYSEESDLASGVN